MAIQFTKMSGSGNDFIVIDNRVPVMEDGKKYDFVRRVGDRKMSVGADGVIFVENSDQADIKWDFSIINVPYAFKLFIQKSKYFWIFVSLPDFNKNL